MSLLKKKTIEATTFAGFNQRVSVSIMCVPLIPADYLYQSRWLQFPVKDCFAITITKTRGQFLKVAGVDLGRLLVLLPVVCCLFKLL